MNVVITQSEEEALLRLKTLAPKREGEGPLSEDVSLEGVLNRISILSKKELLEINSDRSTDMFEKTALFSETSGSTGEPLQTPRGYEELRWNTINQMYAYKRTLQPGIDRVAVVHPSIMSPFVEASCMALHNLGIGYLRIFPIENVCSYKRIFDVLCRYQITAVMTTPSLIRKLFFEFSKVQEANIDQLCLKTLLLTGELVDHMETHLIYEVYPKPIKVLPFVYGSSEVATVMIGREDLLYEPISEDFIFEVISDHSSDVDKKEDVVEGKLLVTWLRNGIVPVVRYDTGDVVKLHKNTKEAGWLVEVLGRKQFTALESEIISSFESVVRSCPKKIFHFDIAKNSGLWMISVIVHDIDIEFVKDFFVSKLEGSGFDVKVNPGGHPFLSKAIKPKIPRYNLL